MQPFKKTIRCALTIASPVHLGCNDVYEPTGFVIDEKNRRLIAFDPFHFIQNLPREAREKFSQLCRKGTVESVLEIYKFFKGKQAVGREVELCNGFVDHYQKVLALNANTSVVIQNLNQFQIARTAFRSFDNRPYIPGTAIKGAIRTACLNARANSKNIRTPRGNRADQELQAKLIGYERGKMETDPFRLVKVSDFMPVGSIRTRIVYAINKKKKASDREARGPYQILEVIEPGACFIGEISVESPLSGKYISNPVTLDELLESLNSFYRKENERECRELAKIKLKGIPIQPQSGTQTLRIGRHSGAESITVNGHRSICIMLGKNKKPDFKDKATTVWLSSETEKNQSGQGLRPFGWTVLQPLSSDLEKQLHAREAEFTYQEMLAEQQRLDEIAEKREQAIREKQEAERLQQEADKREKEKLLRERQWQNMDGTEQDIAIVQKTDLAQEQAPGKDALKDVWPKLEKSEPDIQKRLAQTFIKAWENNPEAWRKKQCSNSQWEKVKKLVEITGIAHPDIQQLDPDEQKLVEDIHALNDFGQFTSSKIIIEDLSLAAGEALKAKFLNWGCNNKKAKKNKSEVWNRLNNHLRQLRRS
ncbi:MAG: type III-A CRISPR-associated RAMP protein Csm5 [Deltaproteobacteria bacterium]|nr:MAG: type III-A CRISPR-associated RAMP protein Csm5 [Deltaproteobacteria bacterium]